MRRLILNSRFPMLVASYQCNSAHSRPVQKERDSKKDAALTAAGIPIIRWKVRDLPTAEQMRQALDPHTR